MNLKEYLDKYKITLTEMASRIGVSKNFLSMVLHGKRKLSLDIALVIRKETKGECTLDELLPPITQPNVCECCGRRLPKNVKHNEM